MYFGRASPPFLDAGTMAFCHGILLSSYLSKYFSLKALTATDCGVNLVLHSCVWTVSCSSKVAGQRPWPLTSTRTILISVGVSSPYQRCFFGASRLFYLGLCRMQQSDCHLHLFFSFLLSKMFLSGCGFYVLYVRVVFLLIAFLQKLCI